MSSFAGKKATVMGLGLFGGGLAVARFLAAKGADVTVTDLRSAPQLRESLQALEGLPIRFVLGEHRNRDFTDADVVIANPAVRLDSPYLRLARDRSVTVSSEVDLFLDACRAPIVAVTGTNGKSTTTALIGEILERSGRFPRVWTGGNIGRPLLDAVEEIAKGDAVVLEISSFQLEAMLPRENWPAVAVVTRITPDHLDRHGSFENYREAKARILSFQSVEGTAILNADDSVSGILAPRCRGRLWRYGKDGDFFSRGEELFYRDPDSGETSLLPRREIRIPGYFNIENVLAAAAAGIAMGAPIESIRSAVASFPGLEHRLERIGERQGVRVFNNAVSTSPESTISAIENIEGEVVLIAGGKGKNLDLKPLAQTIARSCRLGLFYGAAAEQLARECAAAGFRDAFVFSGLSDAVDFALPRLRAPDSLLFSPAFSSYDQYRNFRERGEEFCQLLHAWIGQAGLASDRARRVKPFGADA